MSDNHRRYRWIRTPLSQIYTVEPKGLDAKQLNVLASLISHIVGSRSTNYPKIASKVPDRVKLESRVKRYSHCVNEADPKQEVQLMPFAEQLVANLADHTLVLIMDGSDVGRNCVALMLSVQYRGRALPIGWLVISRKKGDFSEDRHLQLVSVVKELLPKGLDVLFLGDGELDGTQLQQELEEFGWKYACRTASNTILYDGEEFSFQDLLLKPGMCLGVEEVAFTRLHNGPILAVAWWRKDQQEPLYLVSNFNLKEETCYWYQKRSGSRLSFQTKRAEASICIKATSQTHAVWQDCLGPNKKALHLSVV